MTLPPAIAFLHTSPVHVQTFTALLECIRPGTVATHVVNEELLQQARELGHAHPAVVQRVQSAVQAAAESGASVVVCTCSTIGAAAEATPCGKSFKAQRIDRAMADEAARLGPAILVVAALESTLVPTVALIEDSANRLALPATVHTALVPDAWHHFEQGNIPAYLSCVQVAVREALRGHTVVVLSQASMADAATGLQDIGIPVLSSPEIGVRAILAYTDA